MRIIIVVVAGLSSAQIGGVGEVARAQANALVELGHDVLVLTTDCTGRGKRAVGPADQSAYRSLVVPGFSPRRWPGSLGPVVTPGLHRALRKLRSFDPDIVHIHEWTQPFLVATARWAHKNDVPIVVQPHGSVSKSSPKARLRWRVSTLFVKPRNISLWLGSTPAEKSRLLEFVGGKVDVLVNPVSLSETVLWRRPGGSKSICFPHRIVANKGLDFAVRALPFLEGVDLVAYGENSLEFEACRKLADSLGVGDRLFRREPVHRNDLEAALCAHDLVVLPCRWDIFPMSITAALNCGCPVLVSAGCDAAPLFEDGGAQVIDPQTISDPKAFAASLSSALGYGGPTQEQREKFRQLLAPLSVLDRLLLEYEQLAGR